MMRGQVSGMTLLQVVIFRTDSSKLFLYYHLEPYFLTFYMNYHYLESLLKQICGPHFQSF